MPTLRPFRDYQEKDVINMFAYSGTLPVNRGTLVKISTGFLVTDDSLEMLGPVGATYNNTVSERYGTYAKIVWTSAGDAALGILLKDVKEYDENGLPLKFNPIHAAELDVVISGQTVPVVRRGMFLYSGEVLASQSGLPHTKLYAGNSGQLTTGVTVGLLPGVLPAATGVTSPAVGYCLGAKDTNGCQLVFLNIV